MRWFLVFIFALSIPFTSSASELNAGFVDGLWYGTKTIVAGEPTRIYIALRNNTDQDLTGTVRFSDNGNRIGISYVSALPGRIVEAWVDWTPRYGEHTITATLSDVRVYLIGQAPETGDVGDTLIQDTVFVDYDTDKDGIVNAKDDDDDNDTVNDVDEEKRGTDPLKANPIAKPEKDKEAGAPASSAGKGTTSEESRSAVETQPVPSGPRGLEKYIPNRAVSDAITTVTETINDSRTTLDDYRQKRADAIEEYFESKRTTGGQSGDSSVATITRNIIEPKGSFLASTIDAMKALARGGYSLILWMTSRALAHPALLELFLLLFLILAVYRTARRFGRRRYDR